MDDPLPHRLTLELRCPNADGSRDASPVEGLVELADGTVRAFTGWLGLVSELERVLTGGVA